MIYNLYAKKTTNVHETKNIQSTLKYGSRSKDMIPIYKKHVEHEQTKIEHVQTKPLKLFITTE